MAQVIKGIPSIVRISKFQGATRITIHTYKESVNFTKDDDTILEEYSDQDEEPIAIFQTPGKVKITFSTFDYDPATLLLLFGGQVLNGSWYPPDEINLEPNLVTLEVDVNYGSFPKSLYFEKCICKSKFNYNIRRDRIALIDVEIMPVANKYFSINEN